MILDARGKKIVDILVINVLINCTRYLLVFKIIGQQRDV